MEIVEKRTERIGPEPIVNDLSGLSDAVKRKIYDDRAVKQQYWEYRAFFQIALQKTIIIPQFDQFQGKPNGPDLKDADISIGKILIQD